MIIGTAKETYRADEALLSDELFLMHAPAAPQPRTHAHMDHGPWPMDHPPYLLAYILTSCTKLTHRPIS